jgi:hypothetical protein
MSIQQHIQTTSLNNTSTAIMDIAAAFNRSKVMHDNNNMTSAAMDSAEASNSDASLPPYMEESDFDDESEVMGDDLRRRVHEHRRKGERLEKEVCTARKQAWNNRHREAMIVTYDTQDVRRFAQSSPPLRYIPCIHVANALQRGRGNALRPGRLGAHSPEHIHLDRPRGPALSTEGRSVLRRLYASWRHGSRILLGE